MGSSDAQTALLPPAAGPSPGARATGGGLKPYRPVWLLRLLYRRYFAQIAVDEAWTKTVREAATRGTVVYVMRLQSFLDFLCLDHLTKRFGLPFVRFVNDLGLWILEPFGRGWRRLVPGFVRRWLGRREEPLEAERLRTVSDAGLSALLFLKRPPRLRHPGARGIDYEIDHVETLVRLQRSRPAPILLVPHVIVWGKLPATRRRSIFNVLFGPREWPRRLRQLAHFFLNYRNAQLRVGEPIDLSAFVGAHPGEADDLLARRIRFALLRRIDRERRVILGPVGKNPDRLREEVLASPKVREAIRQASTAEGVPVRKIERRAADALDEIAGRLNIYWIQILDRVLELVWNKIYDGLEVDKEGVERVRRAALQGPLVLLPSHKSHVDYLLLSDVLFDASLTPPYVAAGSNLSFWPLGWLFRRGGAFFIRRKFRGDRVYAAVLGAYVRKLVTEGYPVEFFLEGGRSRTGKLLPPKTGMLAMVFDAAMTLRSRRPVQYVPVSIGYDRLVEAGAYLREIAGGEKERESIAGLLRTPRVLRSRYGRVHVNFGEVIAMDRFLEHEGVAGAETVGEDARRVLVTRLAHRVVYEINRVTPVTATSLAAMALLTNPRRGSTYVDFVRSAERLAARLTAAGARFATTLRAKEGTLRTEGLRGAVELLAQAGLVQIHGDGEDAIYGVPDERRMGLDYYKNGLLHFFVSEALVATALLAPPSGPIAHGALRERVQRLSRLFKFEFMFRADAPFEVVFDQTLDAMAASGEVETLGGHVTVVQGDGAERVRLYARLVRNFLEGYRATASALEILLKGPLPAREFGRRALAHAHRLYLSGQVSLREACTRPVIDNATLAMKDRGVLEGGDEEAPLALGAAYASAEAVRAVAQSIGAYLTEAS